MISFNKTVAVFIMMSGSIMATNVTYRPPHTSSPAEAAPTLVGWTHAVSYNLTKERM